MSLIHLLHQKALSKRGYSWTGKLISSLLLTLTHTYPLENKFINPQQWSSEGNSRLFHQPHSVLMTSFRVQEKSPSPLGKALHTERDNSGDK
jgi:proteasome activator subunit 4